MSAVCLGYYWARTRYERRTLYAWFDRKLIYPQMQAPVVSQQPGVSVVKWRQGSRSIDYWGEGRRACFVMPLHSDAVRAFLQAYPQCVPLYRRLVMQARGVAELPVDMNEPPGKWIAGKVPVDLSSSDSESDVELTEVVSPVHEVFLVKESPIVHEVPESPPYVGWPTHDVEIRISMAEQQTYVGWPAHEVEILFSLSDQEE